MSNVDVASITSVPIRNVWPDEATDFTPWLAANLGELATALGLELEAMSTEEPTGSFSLDILAIVWPDEATDFTPWLAANRRVGNGFRARARGDEH